MYKPIPPEYQRNKIATRVYTVIDKSRNNLHLNNMLHWNVLHNFAFLILRGYERGYECLNKYAHYKSY